MYRSGLPARSDEKAVGLQFAAWAGLFDAPTRSCTFLLGAIVSLLPLGSVPGQESAPSDPVAAVRPALTEFRKGEWTLEKAGTVIETLIKQGYPAAASWWTALGDEAIKSKKLAANAQTVLNGLRKRCADLGGTPADRELLLKVARHLETVVSARNFDEARRVAAAASVLSELCPDPAVTKILEAAKRKIEATGNHDAAGLQRQQSKYAELAPLVIETVNKRIDRLQVEYELAACKIGRITIKKAIAESSTVVGAATARLRIRRFNEVARVAEPPKTLSLMVWPRENCRVFLDGDEYTETGKKPFSIPVYGGDFIQVEVTRFFQKVEEGQTPVNAAIVSAMVDDKRVDHKRWSLSRSADVMDLAPSPQPLELRRVKNSDDPVIKKLGFRDEKAQYGYLVTKTPQGTLTAFPVTFDHPSDVEKELDSWSRPYRWVGNMGEACVAILPIPDE